MLLGLVGALGASLCYGVASVLQAVAARSTTTSQGLDPRLLLRLARSWRYLLGLGLDGLGFVLSIVALRTLPLFAVQSIVASFLAVTAVLGAVLLRMPLTRRDVAGVAVVVVGLVLVGLSAAEDRPVPASATHEWGVLVAAVVLGLSAVPLARVTGRPGPVLLGAVAGLGFGVVGIAARMLADPLTIAGLLVDPAAYALLLGAAIALLAYPTALQRGSVTLATAPLVIAETVVPALVGISLLGDAPRPGWGPVAVAGFVLSVGGAVGLARHGEVLEAVPEGAASVEGGA